MDREWLNLGPTLHVLELMAAEGPDFLALAVPGNHSVGPYDPDPRGRSLRPPRAWTAPTADAMHTGGTFAVTT